MTQKMSALALLVAVSLSGCAAQQVATPAPAVQKTVTAPEKTSVLKRELADGLYEMVLNQKGDALFVASSEGFKDVQGGVVYKLDPATLKTIGRSHTDLKNFAMAISPDGSTVYARAETTLVLYDFETARPRRMTPDLRASLERYAGGEVTFRWRRTR